MENTTKGRKLVVIQNPDVTGGHEWELVTKMEKGNHLLWCKDIEDLASMIKSAKSKTFTQFKPEQLVLLKVIEELFR